MLDYVTLGGARPSRFDGICGYASTSAVADGFVSSKLIEKVTYDNRPARANQVASCGDVILARMQSTSKVLEIDEENSGLIYSTGFAVLTPDSSMISQRCLFHLLLSAPFRRRKDQLCTGATQKAITNAGLKKLQVAFPAHKYQEQVVKELDNVLQQIEASRQRLNMLDSLAKSRFVEMFGEPTTRCGRWPLVRLDSFAQVVTGNTPSRKNPEYYGEGIEWVKTDNIVNSAITASAEQLTEAGRAKARIAPAGSILMACIAGSVNSIGKVGLLDREAAFNQQINAIVPTCGVNSRFLLTMLTLSKDYLCSDVNQQLKGILNKTALSAKQFPLPPFELQQQFASFVASVDKSRFVVLNEKISRIQLISRRIAHRFSR